MKHHITVEQARKVFKSHDEMLIEFNLSPVILKSVAKEWKWKFACKRINIGKIIERIERQHGRVAIEPYNNYHKGYIIKVPYPNNCKDFNPKKLGSANNMCDALWESVLPIINNRTQKEK
jgi:hypothetical protein